MMQQRNNSWADVDVEAGYLSKKMCTVASRRRTRQRGSRRGSDAPPLPKRQVTTKDDTSASTTTAGSWTPTQMSTEESPASALNVPPPTLSMQDVLVSPDRCNEVIAKLDHGDKTERHEMLLSIQKGIRQLALSKTGCRVVQKAIEVASTQDLELIVTALRDHIVELYESPHGNYVLAKAIEVLPAAKCDFVISSLLGRGILVCKHRYGCRVMCRLIEHCTEDQMKHLLDEILSEAAMLARHSYGNFVVQGVFEYMSHARRFNVLAQLLPGLDGLAMHRTGSLVVQRLFDFCGSEGQNLALRSLRQADGETSLVEIACSHYGSYVIEQLAGLRQSHSEALAIEASLASNKDRLQTSSHGQRVAVAFGLVSIEQLGGVN